MSFLTEDNEVILENDEPDLMFKEHPEGLGWYSVNTNFKMDPLSEKEMFIIDVLFLNRNPKTGVLCDSYQVLTERLENVPESEILNVVEFYNNYVSKIVHSSEKPNFDNYKFEGISNDLLNLIYQSVVDIKIHMLENKPLDMYNISFLKETTEMKDKNPLAKAAEELMATPPPEIPPVSKTNPVFTADQTENIFNCRVEEVKTIKEEIMNTANINAPQLVQEPVTHEDILAAMMQSPEKRKEMHDKIKEQEFQKSLEKAIEEAKKEIFEKVEKMVNKTEEAAETAAEKVNEEVKKATRDIDWKKASLYAATTVVVVGTCYVVYKRLRS